MTREPLPSYVRFAPDKYLHCGKKYRWGLLLRPKSEYETNGCI